MGSPLRRRHERAGHRPPPMMSGQPSGSGHRRCPRRPPDCTEDAAVRCRASLTTPSTANCSSCRALDGAAPVVADSANANAAPTTNAAAPRLARAAISVVVPSDCDGSVSAARVIAWGFLRWGLSSTTPPTPRRLHERTSMWVQCQPRAGQADHQGRCRDRSTSGPTRDTTGAWQILESPRRPDSRWPTTSSPTSSASSRGASSCPACRQSHDFRSINCGSTAASA